MEVMIAMLIITIVSAAAVSTIRHSQRITARIISCQDSRIAAVNALECFKFSSSESEFDDNCYRAGAFKREHSEVSPDGTAYKSKVNACVVKAYVNYSAADPTFKAICTDNKDKVVFQFSFTKTS